MVEDAIKATSVNRDDVPEGESAPTDSRKIFSIGINCDADSSYNKDPKDANKYEQEGQKVQFDQAAMLDYYMKILNEHPLITYIEDAYAQFDFAGHKMLRERLSNEKPEVNMALKQVFANGGISRMRQVTEPAAPDDKAKPEEGEEEKKDSELGDSGAVRKSMDKSVKSGQQNMKDAKGRITPNLSTPDYEDMPNFDPEDPTKYKVTPDVAVVNMTNLSCISQLVSMFLVPKSLQEE